jgi:hypothetical protein
MAMMQRYEQILAEDFNVLPARLLAAQQERILGDDDRSETAYRTKDG